MFMLDVLHSQKNVQHSFNQCIWIGYLVHVPQMLLNMFYISYYDVIVYMLALMLENVALCVYNSVY